MKWWMREVFSQRIANNREQKAQRMGLDGASRSLREALSKALFADYFPLISRTIANRTSGANEVRTGDRKRLDLSGSRRLGDALDQVRVIRGLRYGTQSAMKMLVSPWDLPCRFEAKTSFFPSGVNIGKPSNVSLKVIRSNPVASVLIE